MTIKEKFEMAKVIVANGDMHVFNSLFTTSLDKERVLFHNTTPTMLTYLKADIREYTVNNGFYPDFIDMPEDIYKEFRAKFIGDIEELRLYGIPIRKV